MKAKSLSQSTKKNLCVQEPSSTSKKWTSAAESKHPPKKEVLGMFYLYRAWNPHSHWRNVKFRNIHQLQRSIVPAMKKNS